MSTLSTLRSTIRKAALTDENTAVHALIKNAPLDNEIFQHALHSARKLVELSRTNQHAQGSLDAFLHQFGLSNKEGIALMCLAEALLRIPDNQTADILITEKITQGDWEKHLGQSNSPFVNASCWALMLTGKLIHPNDIEQDPQWYHNMLQRLGEPIVRNAMLQAMKILGNQYILGSNVTKALARSNKEYEQATRFSFDVLGEGARTEEDAQCYFKAYTIAIQEIAKKNNAADGNSPSHAETTLSQATLPQTTNSISIKLSALHPRYDFRQQERITQELLPRIISLCRLAKSFNMGLSLDAEESHRQELYLDIFTALCHERELEHWQGLGFVLQAYQKRATHIAQWLTTLTRTTQRHIAVRLVKGAYWDSEIKYAQEQGFTDYPVFTEKDNTDLSYFRCAEILLSEQQYIYPQFATHNAYTLSLIQQLGHNKHYGFQRLHGMGSLLYQQLHHIYTEVPPVSIYAPIGKHRDLLPYLVRRLLENGANTSFINRFMDEQTPIDDVVKDITQDLHKKTSWRNPRIPLPKDIFRSADIMRENSQGIDLSNLENVQQFADHINDINKRLQTANTEFVEPHKDGTTHTVQSPSTEQLLGHYKAPGKADICDALTQAQKAQHHWNALGGDARASIIENIAEHFQQKQGDLVALISLEAGRTLEDAINEVREAIDFCRYYAQLARQLFSEATILTSPTGESNSISLHGRGTFVCISPWNFPLAIFTGQITAALAAGNSVIAKPAQQTPLIAEFAINVMHEAGVPEQVLHLILGDGEIGANLVKDQRVDGVAFTGSTITAKKIQQDLAAREGIIVPLIAETGGQNAMIVDSSALLEQVCDDVIHSAFSSAGQRCSALRILFLQDDFAEKFIPMLIGASKEITLGNPWDLRSDMGPLIDNSAKEKIQQHIAQMRQTANELFCYPDEQTPNTGCFIGPHIFEIKTLAQLQEEIFGPILHIIRFKIADIDQVVEQINASKFGLTLGIHTRIEERAKTLFSQVKVGNTYVNRNMIGAMVGVNPFGGWGLSGTGPKAGGPHYLFRFANEKTFTQNLVATGGNPQLLSL